MIAILLMCSWTVYSQNIRTKVVPIPTLVAIYKDLQKCDSLQVAYNSKTIELNSLINTNLAIFKELEVERTKRLLYESELDKANKTLLKATKNSNNTLLWVGGGTLTGIIIGVLINK